MNSHDVLAEVEIWHSRPFTPTRRVSLGNMILPVDPAPGLGGVLLGAIVAAHLLEVDEDLVPDISRLIHQVDRGDRVSQPRLRHRFQVDRHGLARSTHRLLGNGEEIEFTFENAGTALQQVLGAVYVLERLDTSVRHRLAPLLSKAMTWRGPIAGSFVSYLAGAGSSTLAAIADPRAWALEILGFPEGTVKPSKKEIQARFREGLRNVHPDHGGDSREASKLIDELGEARRVLLGS